MTSYISSVVNPVQAGPAAGFLKLDALLTPNQKHQRNDRVAMK